MGLNYEKDEITTTMTNCSHFQWATFCKESNVAQTTPAVTMESGVWVLKVRKTENCITATYLVTLKLCQFVTLIGQRWSTMGSCHTATSFYRYAKSRVERYCKLYACDKANNVDSIVLVTGAFKTDEKLTIYDCKVLWTRWAPSRHDKRTSWKTVMSQKHKDASSVTTGNR